MIGVIQRDTDKHIVRQDRHRQKLKHAVLCGFDGGDVARHTRQGFTDFGTRLAKEPPFLGIFLGVCGIALRCLTVSLRAHSIGQVLIHRRIAVTHLCFAQAVKVDDFYTS